MPLTNIQIDVLRLIASHRDPESYVAGGAPLTRSALRYSEDIDVFHDREERVAAAALSDAATLEAAGFRVSWLRQLPLIYTAEIARQSASTRLEWVVDSDFRFFPTLPDETFGFILHPVDLATNKVMAAAGRREVRDLMDLVTVHETILPLGAVIWAAVEKSPGFTPEGLIAEIRRNSRYPIAEWRALMTSEPIDPDSIVARLRAALDLAEAFAERMPTDRSGLLFLSAGQVVEPDPERLGDYQTHSGRRRGQWPGSSEITTAMLERYQQRPKP
ncbi:MAG TPA: hypothetical protein VKU19_21925 [Bryobacteraceae bacterium]|nr:hypothetical protein [Bryobacteraceae bacterium]